MCCVGLSGLDRNGFPLDSWRQYFPAFSDHAPTNIYQYYIPANPKQASRGGSTLCFDQWQKVVSIRPHFPTVKHTPAKESKVHNGGGPYPRPDLRISWSLHVWGSPDRTWDSRSITAGALTLTLILFPQLFWGPSPPGTALSASQILPTKDLRDLLRDNLFKE